MIAVVGSLVNNHYRQLQEALWETLACHAVAVETVVVDIAVETKMGRVQHWVVGCVVAQPVAKKEVEILENRVCWQDDVGKTLV